MITSVSIRNFRSIERQDFVCNWITTFVGENDAGKSNVLRALNLFFNGYTDADTPFNFERDFNHFARVGKRKARQIDIKIRFLLPAGYQRKEYNNEIEWVKVWRESGQMSDKGYRRYVDGNAFPSRSKIPALLDRIRFSYIPAIKDQRFFFDLQGQLYDVLASVASEPLRNSAENFEEQIQQQLAELLTSINFVFHAESTLRLSDDLRTIFERLEISTNGIPLSRRGDGIKMRHIPMILKFIAEKRDNVLNRGGVRYTHIWGFEEPENSIEMSACFEMAEQFLGIIAKSDFYQLFLTTHSPIFYAIKDPGEEDPEDEAWIHRYFVQKKEQSSEIILKALSDVHESMGLMPLVAPHIEEVKKGQDLLRGELQLAKAIAGKRLPTLFLEGRTDEIVLGKALEVFAPRSRDKIYLQAGGKEGYGSANALASRSLAWLLEMKHRSADARVRAVAIFDGDAEGRKAYKKLNEDLEKLKIQKGPKFKVRILKAPRRLHELGSKHFALSIDLECYFDDSVWEVAEEKGWITSIDDPRAGLNDDMVKEVFRTKVDPRESLDISDRRRLRKRFTKDGKRQTARYVAKLSNEEAESALRELKDLVGQITSHLLPDHQ